MSALKGTINWFLFLIWSLTFGGWIDNKFTLHQILHATCNTRAFQTLTDCFPAMATFSINSDLGLSVSFDLKTDSVDHRKISSMTHHPAAEQFNETFIQGGSMVYFEEEAESKVERFGNGFSRVYYFDMVLLVKEWKIPFSALSVRMIESLLAIGEAYRKTNSVPREGRGEGFQIEFDQWRLFYFASGDRNGFQCSARKMKFLLFHAVFAASLLLYIRLSLNLNLMLFTIINICLFY